jgi:uncharacterized protein (TIGR00251 family)
VIQDTASGSLVHVRVIPRAKRTAVHGTRQNAVLIRLAAPPVDGAANAALISFLADRLGLPARAVRIVAGETSREKRVAVDGLRAEQVRMRLGLHD